MSDQETAQNLVQTAEPILQSEAARALARNVHGEEFDDLCQEGRIAIVTNVHAITSANNPGAMARTVARRAMNDFLKREHSHHAMQ